MKPLPSAATTRLMGLTVGWLDATDRQPRFRVEKIRAHSPMRIMAGVDKEYDGEVWCISKHLLAASMRLMEVGTKQLGMDKKDEAYDLFGKAYNLYSLFWGLNMKLIDPGEIKKIDDNALNKDDKEKKGFMGRLGVLVKKAVDCCLE